jgi:hypothetical protein
MGLETDSRQDLFVLRNVVMSPFQGAGNYSEKIAELFKGVLQEEVQVFLTDICADISESNECGRLFGTARP